MRRFTQTALLLSLGLVIGAIVMNTQVRGSKDHRVAGPAAESAAVASNETGPGSPDATSGWRKLTREEARVIEDKGTERPFSGKYDRFFENGTYACRRCGTPLYLSANKFDAHCGWPSFDDEIAGAVRRLPDPDGRRTEIECVRCGAHLGHVFLGEGMTPKDTRHCVNSISLEFVPVGAALQGGGAPAHPTTETAVFAGGCFWGVEYQMKRLPGVLSVRSGYTGGTTENPTYAEVCSGKTGHAEAVEVVFDPAKVSYETLVRRFFETHDPTQVNRQGPDIGLQYRSAVFCTNEAQRLTTEELIGLLRGKGYKVATRIEPGATFWPAEGYHQNYYDLRREEPYCHVYTKRF